MKKKEEIVELETKEERERETENGRSNEFQCVIVVFVVGGGRSQIIISY